MVRLAFSREASVDLEDIFAFSRDRFGFDTADEYLTGLEHTCHRLIEFPESGPAYPGVRPPMRMIGYRSHNIFYYFDGRTVLIVRILHQAMNAARLRR